MSKVTIFKGEDGKFRGVGQKGERAWNKWLKRAKETAVGETLTFSYWLPRSPRHHRKFFAMLGALLDRQEQFDDLDSLRAWLTVGAGYCSFVPGPSGRMVAIPQSISFENLDEADFSELHSRVTTFILNERAHRFLWGHLSPDGSFAMAEQLVDEFSQ